MKKNETTGNRFKFLAPLVISFVIVFSLMYFIFRFFGYAPWGNRSLATDDGYWQYMDFFGYFKDALAGKQSLNYSFSNGIGMPGLALFMYYLSSPWNLLIVFFKKENFHDFFDLIVALKLATAGSTAAFYLKKRFKDVIPAQMVVGLAVSYAFTQYNFSKAASTMWLDGVYMLPLILWGVYRVVREKKPLFLSVSVGLAIVFNWYSAGMDCMFSILWFVVEFILFFAENKDSETKKNIKNGFFCIVRYGMSMAIGVGLSACLFLPMAYQMVKATRGSADWDFLKSYFHGNIFNIVPKYTLGSFSDRGALCLFSGGLVLLGIIGFFSVKRISKITKWVLSATLLLGVLSCYWQPLYFVTSLFQDASSYFYRYEYTCCFTMLFMAGCFFASEAENREAIEKSDAGFVIKGVLIYILLIFASNYLKYDTDDKLIYQTAGLQAVILIVFLIVNSKKKNKTVYTVSAIFLCAVTVFEMTYNATLLMDRFSGNTNVAAFEEYQTQQEDLVESVKAADNSAYRMTQTAARAKAINQIANLNESMGFGYWAIENYTSMPAATQVDFLQKAGYVVYRSILVEKAMSIIPIDSLLGVKYVLSPYPYKEFNLREELGSGNEKSVYENPYAMPMAFKTSSADYPYCDYGNNTYLWQNELFKYVTGEDRDIFIPAEFFVSGEEWNYRTYSFNIPAGNYALYGNIPWFTGEPWWTNEGASLDLNGRMNISYSAINSMTNFYVPISKGDTAAYVTLYTDILDRFSEPQFYLLDLDYLAEISVYANENKPADLVVENGLLSCSVTAEKGDKLFTSVPYFRGWEIKVNGKKVTPELVEDCLITVPLENGENKVVMRFHTPFMGVGIAGSVISLAALILWVLWESGKVSLPKRKKSR